MKPIVEEASVELALDWLRDNADALGLARGEVHRLEREEDVVYSRLYLNAPPQYKTIDDRKAHAKGSDEYQKATAETARALYNLESLRTMKTRCEMLVQVWQTQSANLRGKL